MMMVAVHTKQASIDSASQWLPSSQLWWSQPLLTGTTLFCVILQWSHHQYVSIIKKVLNMLKVNHVAVFIVNFEYMLYFFPVFLSLTFNR